MIGNVLLAFAGIYSGVCIEFGSVLTNEADGKLFNSVSELKLQPRRCLYLYRLGFLFMKGCYEVGIEPALAIALLLMSSLKNAIDK